jgi:hypothetical protein
MQKTLQKQEFDRERKNFLQTSYPRRPIKIKSKRPIQNLDYEFKNHFCPDPNSPTLGPMKMSKSSRLNNWTCPHLPAPSMNNSCCLN